MNLVPKYRKCSKQKKRKVYLADFRNDVEFGINELKRIYYKYNNKILIIFLYAKVKRNEYFDIETIYVFICRTFVALIKLCSMINDG